MRSGSKWMAALFLTALCGGMAVADDVSGADEILCASVQATVCTYEGECEIANPWNWDIPAFVEIDVDQRMLSTTEASAERRQTPIQHLERGDGRLVLQGYEGGRAFSFFIHEKSGELSVAVARDGMTVSVFGACTPRAAKSKP